MEEAGGSFLIVSSIRFNLKLKGELWVLTREVIKNLETRLATRAHRLSYS